MSPPRPHEQLTILEAMVLIAGVAFGLWMFNDKREKNSEPDGWVIVAVSVLGGSSIAVVPMMLVDRIRHRRRWRSGAFLWFGIGLVCWGLAPAITIERLKISGHGSVAPTCLVYMLPLIGLFFLAAAAVGGQPIRHWWTCRGWWPEWLGMYVLIGLAATGVYVMYSIYKDLF